MIRKSKCLPKFLCILIYVKCKIYIRNISHLSILLCYLCDYFRNDSFVVFKTEDAAQISEPLQKSVRVSKYGIIARDMYCRGGLEVELSPRMRVPSPVATDLSRKNR